MAVSRSQLFCAILFFTSAICSAGDKEISQDKILQHFSERVMLSTAKLGEAITACEESSRSNSMPSLDDDQLTELNASREDLLIALAHLNFVNHLKCTQEANFSLAFELGALRSAKEELGVPTENVNEAQGKLVYPSVKTAEYALKYAELPADLRSYLEEVVGEDPFELIAMLQSNGLFID